MEAIILTADGAEDLQLLYPYYRLREEGVGVDIAAPEKGNVTTLDGKTVEANVSFWDMHAGEYDLLVIPGGNAPEVVRLDERALQLTRAIHEAGKPVAAVCHGPQVLISADIIRDRTISCAAGIRDDVTAAGAQYADEPVAVDENLVTGRGGPDLPAFCREMVHVLRRQTESPE